MGKGLAAAIVLAAVLLGPVVRWEAGWARSGAPRVEAQAARGFDPAAFSISLQPFATGFTRPLFVTHAGDGSGRLFVVEQGGKVWIVAGGARLPQPFIDITSLLGASTGEQGLLGIAFHPGYAGNGRFFLAYTATDGGNTVAEFRVSAGNPNQANAAPVSALLAMPDFASNHNGGMLDFGPDGYLYLATGDGGGGGDPQGNGQRLDTLLGKILRIDVDRTDPGLPYAIPQSNPFKGQGERREIWAYGLRNPWRFSFDRSTGDLYIGDVGQGAREEVDFEAAGSAGGRNYGWNRTEGSVCFPSGSACNPSLYTLPVVEYDHSLGCSITGGYVYRGLAQPVMAGGYFYGDFCSGRIWVADRDAAGRWRSTEKLDSAELISSFGEDAAGEVYVAAHGSGTVFRLVASAGPTSTPSASPTAMPSGSTPPKPTPGGGPPTPTPTGPTASPSPIPPPTASPAPGTPPPKPGTSTPAPAPTRTPAPPPTKPGLSARH